MKKGMIVLYTEMFDADQSESPNVGPAIVTRVHPDDVLDLTVFFMNGFFLKSNIHKGEPSERGTWHSAPWLRE